MSTSRSTVTESGHRRTGRVPGDGQAQLDGARHSEHGTTAMPPGRWILAGVSRDPRRAAPVLAGRFEIGVEPSDISLHLDVATPGSGVPAILAVGGRRAGVDHSGAWRFEGRVVDGGTSQPVDVLAEVHGVFGRGDRRTASMTLRVRTRARETAGRRRFVRSPGPRHLFEIDVNAMLDSCEWAATAGSHEGGGSVERTVGVGAGRALQRVPRPRVHARGGSGVIPANV